MGYVVGLGGFGFDFGVIDGSWIYFDELRNLYYC